jgi:hypothetical protein
MKNNITNDWNFLTISILNGGGQESHWNNLKCNDQSKRMSKHNKIFEP